MADINEVISLGLGSPSSVKAFLLLGLQIGAAVGPVTVITLTGEHDDVVTLTGQHDDTLALIGEHDDTVILTGMV